LQICCHRGGKTVSCWSKVAREMVPIGLRGGRAILLKVEWNLPVLTVSTAFLSCPAGQQSRDIALRAHKLRTSHPPYVTSWAGRPVATWTDGHFWKPSNATLLPTIHPNLSK